MNWNIEKMRANSRSKSNSFKIPKKAAIPYTTINPSKTNSFDGESLLSKSCEYKEMVKIFKDSFVTREKSTKSFSVTKIVTINNSMINHEFETKRQEMKEERYSEKQREITNAFLPVYSQHQIDLITAEGLTVNQICEANLGNPTMGVHVCKYSDVTTPWPLIQGSSGAIIILQVLKGRVKNVGVNSVTFEPTPMHDSHIAIDSSQKAQTHRDKYLQSRIYLYEYKDVKLRDRPRNLKPIAVLHYKYNGIDSVYGNSVVLRPLKENEVWQGNLKFPTQLFQAIKMMSYFGQDKIKHLSEEIAVRNILPMQKFMNENCMKDLAKNGLICKQSNIQCRGMNFKREVASYWRLENSVKDGKKSKFGKMIESMSAEKTVGVSYLCGNGILLLMPNCELSVMLGIATLAYQTNSLHCVLFSKKNNNREKYDLGNNSMCKVSECLRPGNNEIWRLFGEQHDQIPENIVKDVEKLRENFGELPGEGGKNGESIVNQNPILESENEKEIDFSLSQITEFRDKNPDPRIRKQLTALMEEQNRKEKEIIEGQKGENAPNHRESIMESEMTSHEIPTEGLQESDVRAQRSNETATQILGGSEELLSPQFNATSPIPSTESNSSPSFVIQNHSQSGNNAPNEIPSTSHRQTAARNPYFRRPIIETHNNFTPRRFNQETMTSDPHRQFDQHMTSDPFRPSSSVDHFVGPMPRRETLLDIPGALPVPHFAPIRNDVIQNDVTQRTFHNPVSYPCNAGYPGYAGLLDLVTENAMLRNGPVNQFLTINNRFSPPRKRAAMNSTSKWPKRNFERSAEIESEDEICDAVIQLDGKIVHNSGFGDEICEDKIETWSNDTNQRFIEGESPHHWKHAKAKSIILPVIDLDSSLSEDEPAPKSMQNTCKSPVIITLDEIDSPQFSMPAHNFNKPHIIVDYGESQPAPHFPAFPRKSTHKSSQDYGQNFGDHNEEEDNIDKKIKKLNDGALQKLTSQLREFVRLEINERNSPNFTCSAKEELLHIFYTINEKWETVFKKYYVEKKINGLVEHWSNRLHTKQKPICTLEEWVELCKFILNKLLHPLIKHANKQMAKQIRHTFEKVLGIMENDFTDIWESI